MTTKAREKKSEGQSKSKRAKKSGNPLFVVTNKGEVVEEAKGLFDAFVKKYQLAPYVEMVQNLWVLMLQQIQTYAVLKNISDYLAGLFEELRLVLKKAEDLGRPYLKAVGVL